MTLKTLESTNYELTFLHGEPKQSNQNLFLSRVDNIQGRIAKIDETTFFLNKKRFEEKETYSLNL
jgi:hypothetical protein